MCKQAKKVIDAIKCNKTLGCLVGLTALFFQIIILGLFFKHLAGTENSISFIDIVWRDLCDWGRNLVIPTIMILLAIAISVLLAITVSKKRKEEQVQSPDENLIKLLKEWEEIYNS